MNLYNNRYDILASTIAPNPTSTKYWADLNSDPSGGIIKYYNNGKWELINYLEKFLDSKVDKVEGKQLSTEDYTTEEKNKLASINDESLEAILAYGVERDVDSLNPSFYRIGSDALHRSLPVQSMMRGCTLADDGTVNHYFNDDWTANEDGTEIKKDGSDGMVMIEIPEFYLKIFSGDREGYMISTYPLNGYTKIAKTYISAYEATVDRSTATLKLASVANSTATFRGGNNNSSLDSGDATQLGKPLTNTSRANFRTYARNRYSSSYSISPYAWNMYDMFTHNILWILYTIEYASTNSQLAVNNKLDSNGFKQGGLGNGVTTISSSDWNSFNSYYPIVPCGTSDSLGNGSGEVSYSLPSSFGDGSVKVTVPRYRGIENPFGHIWKNADGAIFDIKTDADGGTSTIYYCADPKYYADSVNSNYSNLGQLPRANGYVSKVVNGTVFPTKTGGSSTTGICDNFYTSVTSSSLRTCFVGGGSSTGAGAGLAAVSSSSAVGSALASYGSRLVFRTDASY